MRRGGVLMRLAVPAFVLITALALFALPSARKHRGPVNPGGGQVVSLNDLGGPRSLRDRKSTRLNSSHYQPSRMPSSA